MILAVPHKSRRRVVDASGFAIMAPQPRLERVRPLGPKGTGLLQSRRVKVAIRCVHIIAQMLLYLHDEKCSRFCRAWCEYTTRR